MKALSGLLFLLLAFVAASSTSSETTELPACALVCLEGALENSTCAITNQTCICLNTSLQIDLTTCVAKSCTFPESLITQNVTETACGAPIRNKSKPLYTMSICLCTISGAIVVLRFTSKLLANSEFALDDFFIAMSLVVDISINVLIVTGLISNGLGRDIWTLTPEQITHFLRIFYTTEVFYLAQVAVLKLSLLFFYLRIFPGTSIQRLLWGTIILTLCFGIIFVFISIFQCQPIDYYWNKWDGEHHGTCINGNGFTWANAAISIVLDGWMLALPISQLFKLQLHWKKKVGVGIMFVVGTIVTIVSILRLQSLVHFSKTSNPSWDDLTICVWSDIEINVGIVCACMPHLRLLLIRFFPKLLGTSQHSNNRYHVNNSHSHVEGNISVIRTGKPLNSNQSGSSATGITYSQTYVVQWGEQDETKSIQMSDLDRDVLNSSGRVSEIEL
ncbi:hypothetical protein L207DRAFT_602395 [Hyaloscypha variabilis F]|uniref:CFEM domain-containing protein n=1 Tax=Hyaloscypha variabilis (strain UAMH 11265 / GT02V1 / F) TaxID=1149755 RepID=A0A2J6RCV1_HYAVF|nr:hypothetical protein L207DRAFT_602395 [Hyaloscypha variabilis F]